MDFTAQRPATASRAILAIGLRQADGCYSSIIDDVEGRSDGTRDTEAPAERAPPKARRSVPLWVALLLGAAVIASLAFVALTRRGGTEQAATDSAPGAVRELAAPPSIDDVLFGSCQDAQEENLPPGIQLTRAGAVISEDHVLLVAELDGPFVESSDAQGGDWQLSVALQLWDRVGDGSEELYEFNVGDLNFAGLVPSKGRDGGLVDPAKVDYFVDGTYVGVLVEMSALTAIDDVKSLSLVAQGVPQVYIDNGIPASRTGVLVGWEARNAQWCPGESGTLPIGFVGNRSDGTPSNSTTTSVTTTSTSAPPDTTTTSAPALEIECEGVSGCSFDNGIDFSILRSELAAALTGDGFPTESDDVDCDMDSQRPPNRVPVGSSFGCVVMPEANGALTYFDVTVTGAGKYSWEYLDV